jgi:glutathione S-transferase
VSASPLVDPTPTPRSLVVSDHRLVLHQHPFASFCWKALIALYELELAFESHVVEDDAGREELARLWPMASIPVLRDETADLTLPESSTIVEYLDALAPGPGRLLPDEPERVLQARLWDRIVDDYVARPMQRIVADSLRTDDGHDPTGVDEARGQLHRAYALLEAHFADHRWAAGADFTIADCAAASALFYARVVHAWDEARHAHLTRYYRDLVHRPSVRRVIDEARPHRQLFPLAWPGDVDAHQAAR